MDRFMGNMLDGFLTGVAALALLAAAAVCVLIAVVCFAGAVEVVRAVF